MTRSEPSIFILPSMNHEYLLAAVHVVEHGPQVVLEVLPDGVRVGVRVRAGVHEAEEPAWFVLEEDGRPPVLVVHHHTHRLDLAVQLQDVGEDAHPVRLDPQFQSCLERLLVGQNAVDVLIEDGSRWIIRE